MHRYVIKRLLMLIPVLLGISFILFSIMNLTPGDPARMILGDSATVEGIAELREELGLNGSFFSRYFTYLSNALTGDFGVSYRTRTPVFEEIFSRMPYTVTVAAGAISISAILGVSLGILSAVKQYSLADNLTLAATLLLTSMPDFWLGLILIIIFSVNLNLLPSIAGGSFSSYLMPWCAASAGYLASTIRTTRSTMLDTVNADYVRTAKAKGAPKRDIIFRHSLRNAMLPVVTLIGINMGWQLGGTIIIEQVFAIPGIGSLLLTSIRLKDTPVVIASVSFVCILASLINLAADLLYAYIDPRVKAQYTKG
jgi:peptide/nickel transport system permease protein